MDQTPTQSAPFFKSMIDLAGERVGGHARIANDEFFAPKENLLKPGRGVFIEDQYTDRGKWMDGWETRRRREPGHDWVILKLGLPGIIRGITVDTNHFRGNFPASCALDAIALPGDPSADELSAVNLRWVEALSPTALQGHAENHFAVKGDQRFTHVRLRIYPDGGVARLRVHGEVVPDWDAILKSNQPVDLIAVQHGGAIIDCSDMFFSHPLNLLMPGRAVNMGDGWETKRRRGPGHDWVNIKLGRRGVLKSIEVDTNHFKGNYPESCSIDGGDATQISFEQLHDKPALWTHILPRIKLHPHAQQVFVKEIIGLQPVTHLRLNIFPDGGVSRLRALGVPVEAKAVETPAGLTRLNELAAEQAESQFMRCCGSMHWAGGMVDHRPYAGLAQVMEASDQAFAQLNKRDWLEAFGQHPRIGALEPEKAKPAAGTRDWSRQEQSGVATAEPDVLRALVSANQAYEKKFGHVFLICAAGKSAEDMLAAINARLANDPATEYRIAAEQLRLITRLRLEKLVQS